MPTVEIDRGRHFEVRAWSDDGENVPLLDFLDELKAAGNPDYFRLLGLIARTANDGISSNKQHVRSLGDYIFEFKARENASRILFFYDKGRLIICSHGFSGKKGSEKKFISRQKKRAAEIRKSYFDEIGKAK